MFKKTGFYNEKMENIRNDGQERSGIYDEDSPNYSQSVDQFQNENIAHPERIIIHDINNMKKLDTQPTPSET